MTLAPVPQPGTRRRARAVLRDRRDRRRIRVVAILAMTIGLSACSQTDMPKAPDLSKVGQEVSQAADSAARTDGVVRTALQGLKDQIDQLTKRLQAA